MSKLNTDPRAIAFDFGNVLVHWEPFLALQAHFADHDEMETCLAQIGFYDWNLEQDRGRSWQEGLIIATNEHPNHRHIFEAYHQNLHRTVSRAIPGMRELVRSLHGQGFALFGLTNAPFGAVDHIRQTVPELDLMRDIIVSADEGIVKPNPEIYQVLLHRSGLEASDVLFIDDNEENCAAAQRLGMSAVQFKGPGKLRLNSQIKSLLWN
ncbi:MAG: HAD family hydrolase [Pelagimonas sp.]|uniref:HAD family hydrolase n=1 Tax=Pelagimonas sp. TaxID=2073170 RepID=UPI003D6ABE2E